MRHPESTGSVGYISGTTARRALGEMCRSPPRASPTTACSPTVGCRCCSSTRGLRIVGCGTRSGMRWPPPGIWPGWTCAGSAPPIVCRLARCRTVSMVRTSRQDCLLDLRAGLGRHRVRSRRTRGQTSVAFSGVAVNPGFHALAGHTHCGGDVGLLPAGLVALDDQSSTVNGQPGTTVEHENLRVGVGLRQATSHPEVLPRSTRLAATNVTAEYT